MSNDVINNIHGVLDADSDPWLMLRDHSRFLKRRGTYELWLLAAWLLQGRDTAEDDGISFSDIEKMFAKADTNKLQALTDPLPQTDGVITLYRGVSGVADYTSGLSWTDDLNIAVFFAHRWDRTRKPEWAVNPTVYTTQVPVSKLLCFLHESGKNEREYIVLPKSVTKIEKVNMTESDAYLRSRQHYYDSHFRLQSTSPREKK